MNINDYKLKHSLALRQFLMTDAGRELFVMLKQLRPNFITNTAPHAHTESAGAVRGYELCESNLVFLSMFPIIKEEIEMTYGVEPLKPKE